jgi:membrane protease YdiL (CAAX protease family)
VSFSPIVLGYAIALTLGLPLLAFRGGLREEHVEEVVSARATVYFSAAVSVLLLVAVTFGISAWQSVDPSAVGWKVDAAVPAFAWAAAAAVAGIAVVWLVVRLGQRFGLPESRISFVLMPRSGPEQRAFLVVAAVAAVGEEYLYRGFLYHVFVDALGGAWPAALLTSVSFGVAHGYQRAIGMTRAGLLGVLLVLPVAFTGSLFPSIVAHFWINVAIGLGGWRLLFPSESEVARTATEKENENGET